MITLLLIFSIVAAIPQFAFSQSLAEKQQKKIWSALCPDFARAQYAGSIGVISIGTGWDYGQRQQWETDFMLGYLPAFATDRQSLTVTLRETFVPWQIELTPRLSIKPLTCGIFFNSICNDKFWIRQPRQYERNYWDIETKIRANVFVGHRLSFSYSDAAEHLFHSVEFDHSFSICDLDIVRISTNRTFHFWQVLSMSVGLKFNF